MPQSGLGPLSWDLEKSLCAPGDIWTLLVTLCSSCFLQYLQSLEPASGSLSMLRAISNVVTEHNHWTHPGVHAQLCSSEAEERQSWEQPVGWAWPAPAVLGAQRPWPRGELGSSHPSGQKPFLRSTSVLPLESVLVDSFVFT